MRGGGSVFDRHLLLRVIRTLIIGTGALVVVAGGSGPVAAHDSVIVEAGASGTCGGGGGSGGSFETHVGDHVEYISHTDPEELNSTASAARYFVHHEGDCGSDGYLEAHANSIALTVQYCYSEESDGDPGDEGNGDEPTDSVTASNGAGELNIADQGGEKPPGKSGEADGNTYCEYDKDGSETGSEDLLTP